MYRFFLQNKTLCEKIEQIKSHGIENRVFDCIAEECSVSSAILVVKFELDVEIIAAVKVAEFVLF